MKKGFCRIKNENDVWQSWKGHLESCKCHDFCLGKYHSIECGYSIKCKPSYDENLYNHLTFQMMILVQARLRTVTNWFGQSWNWLNENAKI